jgi:Flp pilus assembly protein TadD
MFRCPDSSHFNISSWIVSGALFALAGAFGQPLFVQPTEPGPVSIRTFAGRAECTANPVTSDPRLTAAVLVDGIDPHDMERVLTELTGLYRALHAAHPITLAVHSGHEWQTAGPFRSPPQWRASLNKLLKPRPAASDAYSATQLYELLADSAPQFGSDWASVILVGKLPPVDADLRDYAAAYLGSKFRAQRLRVSYWPVGGEQSELWDRVARMTGGVAVKSSLDELVEKLAGETPALEVICRDPALDRGFVVYRAARLDAAGNVIEEIPSLVVAPGKQPADLDHYAELRKSAHTAADLFQQPATQERLNQIRISLQAALAINPADSETLRLAVDFYKRYEEHKTAAGLLSTLGQTDPLNPVLLAEVGHERFVTGDLKGAEQVLTRSRELHPADAHVAEDLARIQIARENFPAALPLLEESLQADANNAELWFLRASTAAKLGDWARMEDSLEHGLVVSPNQLAHRTELVRLYLDHHQAEPALRHVQFVVNALPPEAPVRATWAGFLEEMQKPDEALPLWRKAIEADPTMENAHYRVARLLIDRGDLAGAVAAADAGVASVPKSGRLYVVKSEAVEKRGDFYGARRVLRMAAPSLEDAPLQLRLAQMEDVSGLAAAHEYVRAAKLLQPSSPQSPEYLSVLRRGLDVSIRDGDYDSVAWFSARLSPDGQPPSANGTSARDRSTKNGVWVPGGLEALAFIARSKANAPPGRFFEDYCRVIHTHANRPDRKEIEAYLEPIREHFRLVAALEALGEREGHKVKIVLSLRDKATRRRTEQFINLLGWKMHANKKAVTLEAGEKTSQAKRQETASALAIDEVGLQEALQQNQPYTLEITDDWATLVLSEETWRGTFYPKQQFAGGFAEAVLHEPRMAKAYVGFTRLNQQTTSVMLSGIGLKRLAEKYGDLFYEYSSSLAIENDRAAVPGGTAAETVWQKLAGADPRDPGRFFQALFEKDDGKLLAFYATLSQLDAQHQRFFTLNASRAGKFYELLRETPEFASGISHELRSNSFIELLRGVPLTAGGDVSFPGSPEVWMVAKGRTDAASAGKLAKKLAKAAAPDQEDEILLRLARTRYGAAGIKASELDNFLAVTRIDAHRSKPLDEASALLLAQAYTQTHALYPYFAILSGLEHQHFQQMFALAEKLHSVPELEQNVVLGELHSLIQLLCLAQEAGHLTEQQSAALFALLCDRFLKSGSPAEYAAASLDVARNLIRTAAGQSSSPDDALREMLLGRPSPLQVNLDGVPHEIDPVKVRHSEYQQVLDLQKATPLAPLFAMQDAAAHLAAGQGNSAEAIKALETAAASLQDLPLPKKQNAKGKEKTNLKAFQATKVRDTIAHVRKQAAKNKSNPKDLQKLCQDLMAEINPQVKIALSGIIYAYYLRPADLLVAEDPLLLRKHQFKVFDPLRKQEVFSPSELVVDSGGIGSYFEGGFASFSKIAGRAAAANAKSNANIEAVLAHQLGSLRATPWNRLEDQDLRLASLKVRLAREWILEAAARPEARAGLADATLGLLSRARRSDLMNGVDARDWKLVWSVATLSDLYFLADRYLARNKTDLWQSPVTVSLRRELDRKRTSRQDLLGATLPELFACDHSHMLFLAPYEEYARYMLPGKLAERAAEFKLYLAVRADSLGVPAAALGLIAETLARQILAAANMSDLRDWSAIPAAMERLNDSALKTALDKS